MFPFSYPSQLGPVIGGLLSRPADRFPGLFGGNEFLRKYPYFLSCAAPATFTVLASSFAFLFLKETLPNPTPLAEILRVRKPKADQSHSIVATEPSLDLEKPVSLRCLLTYEVILAAANYALLSLVDISFRGILPVFLSTPIKLGGLGLSPPTIGKLLSVLGGLKCLFQVFFFAKIHDRLGSKKVFLTGLMLSLPAFVLFPVINILARNQGYSIFLWSAVGAQVISFVFLSMSFGVYMIFVAPVKILFELGIFRSHFHHHRFCIA